MSRSPSVGTLDAPVSLASADDVDHAAASDAFDSSFPWYRKSIGTKPVTVPVQSVARNLSESTRNVDLEGHGERIFSDLRDGDGDV